MGIIISRLFAQSAVISAFSFDYEIFVSQPIFLDWLFIWNKHKRRVRKP
eukprot:UN11431